jgi:hypothetical protein
MAGSAPHNCCRVNNVGLVSVVFGVLMLIALN